MPDGSEDLTKTDLDKDNADLDAPKNVDHDNMDLGAPKNVVDQEKDNADLDAPKSIDNDNMDVGAPKHVLDQDKDNLDLDEQKNLDKDNADLGPPKNLDHDNMDVGAKGTPNQERDNADLGAQKKTPDKDNADLKPAQGAIDQDNVDLSGVPAPPPSVGASATPGASSGSPPAAATPSKPSFFSRMYSQLKSYASQAADKISDAAAAIRNRFSSSPAAPVPPGGPQGVTPPTAPPSPTIQNTGPGQALGPEVGQAQPGHVGVRLGTDEAHLMPRGQGLTTGGTFESVEHDGGTATVHFKSGSHEQVLSVDENSPSGKAVSEALDHVHPGDQMSVKIGHDENKQDVIEVADKTSGYNAVVHDGKVEEKSQTPNVDRNQGLNR